MNQLFNPTTEQMIDIYICKIDPQHEDIGVAKKQVRNCKFWVFIAGIPRGFMLDVYSEWPQFIANDMNRHVITRTHFVPVSDEDDAQITELFSPDKGCEYPVQI